LPEAGFGKNVVIDAHRCRDHRIYPRHPSPGGPVIQDYSSKPVTPLHPTHAIASAAERLRSDGNSEVIRFGRGPAREKSLFLSFPKTSPQQPVQQLDSQRSRPVFFGVP